ncbi:PKD domain containing protein [Candidatus Moduliflexus flocculans]|uniref:PKD domain containing protein n=1 Tax=Candidatus Moduliflexus flocculans TaxID=1499966 RepID=A0A0S6VVL9_9BACT|nr:PKD domain containing protein [Candidatus Moduliflexus flocculans]
MSDTLQVSDTFLSKERMFFKRVFELTLISLLCSAPVSARDIVKIHAIQGNGASTPMTGAKVAIQGVVTADFRAANQLNGFFMQEENDDADADPTTSEGVFVYDPDHLADVAVGDLAQVSGTVSEYKTLTEIAQLTKVSVLSRNNPLPTPAALTLPMLSADAFERFEGMLVTFPQTLTVIDNSSLGRYGEIALAASGRRYQLTQQRAPDRGQYAAYQASAALNTLYLDDAMRQNPDPIAYPGFTLNAVNSLRIGYEINNLTGVMDYSASHYRLHATQALQINAAANPRPPAPAFADSTLRVASFNLFNYYNTFSGCAAGVGGIAMECRGANNAAEFERQAAKTVAAIIALNADILGVMELENDGYGAESSIHDLAQRVNAATAPGTYSFLDADARAGRINSLGADAIRVGLLYKPAAVEPVGVTGILDASARPEFDSSQNHPALAQTFREIASGATLTIVVNHLKAKLCTDATGADTDQRDGQGCWNATRTNAAAALASWLAADPTQSGDPDALILGDLNAYAQEDPLRAMTTAGYTDLVAQFNGATAYSYMYEGASGTLDYALTNASLLPQVVGAAIWHINADEPKALDYNMENKTARQIADLYRADPHRSSDHDPVVVGLKLIKNKRF